MYAKSYTTDDSHIDVQGIMDGLYYPFYMEHCRHDFLKEVLDFDLEAEAKQGVNMVLAQYTLKFLRPLKKEDQFNVSCYAFADKEKPKIYLRAKDRKRREGVYGWDLYSHLHTRFRWTLFHS